MIWWRQEDGEGRQEQQVDGEELGEHADGHAQAERQGVGEAPPAGIDALVDENRQSAQMYDAQRDEERQRRQLAAADAGCRL